MNSLKDRTAPRKQRAIGRNEPANTQRQKDRQERSVPDGHGRKDKNERQ